MARGCPALALTLVLGGGCAVPVDTALTAHNVSAEVLSIRVVPSVDRADDAAFAGIITGPGGRLELFRPMPRSAVALVRRWRDGREVGEPLVIPLVAGGRTTVDLEVTGERVIATNLDAIRPAR